MERRQISYIDCNKPKVQLLFSNDVSDLPFSA